MNSIFGSGLTTITYNAQLGSCSASHYNTHHSYYSILIQDLTNTAFMYDIINQGFMHWGGL